MKKLILDIKKNLFSRLKKVNYTITPQWLVGFFEAEGSFITTKSNKPRIDITQHASDYILYRRSN